MSKQRSVVLFKIVDCAEQQVDDAFRSHIIYIYKGNQYKMFTINLLCNFYKLINEADCLIMIISRMLFFLSIFHILRRNAHANQFTIISPMTNTSIQLNAKLTISLFWPSGIHNLNP